MLGSIQKYRPTRRPEPYNNGTIRQLQGIPTSPKGGPVKGNHGNLTLTKDESIFMQSSGDVLKTNMSFMPKIKTASVAKNDDSPTFTKSTRTRNSVRREFQTIEHTSNTNRGFDSGLGLGAETIEAENMMRTHVELRLQSQYGSQFSGSLGFQTKRNNRNTGLRQASTNVVSQSLYSMERNGNLGQLGRQIHSKLRHADSSQIANTGNTARMQFGSPEKYSGFKERHWEGASLEVGENNEHSERAARLYGSVGQIRKRSSTGRFDLKTHLTDNDKVCNSRHCPLPTAVNTILQHQHAMDQLNPLDEVNPRESLLSDSYLPILRGFATKQRATILPSEEVISNFKKDQAAEGKKGHVPKVIQQEVINKSIKSSLFDRQRDILMHAQMQNNLSKSDIKAMKDTKFKDWVVQKDKPIDVSKEKPNASATAPNAEDDKSSSQSSYDRYDPLADSDCSSAKSDTPKVLSQAEMQDVIRTQMRDKVNINNIQKGFWKSLVSMDDPNLPVDEEGNTIEAKKPEISSFQMIKKMMRLKKKQEAVPENERVKNFIPQNKPEFTSDGKEKYYFDLKNNKEHYAMMTNDMSENQYDVFEQREQSRIDDLHHQRKLMETLVERRLEQYRKAKEDREATRNKKIDISTLGQYRSKKFLVDELESLFQDDDELLLMQVLMDTSDRKEMRDAIKNHVGKQQNRKAMLCPQRVLRLSDYARDVIDGIIWQEIKERKVHPRVLYKMSTQESMSIMVNKELARKRELEKLNKILSKPNVRGSNMSKHSERMENHQDNGASDEEKDETHLYKDLFIASQKKNQFFEAAKQMMNSNSLAAATTVSQSHMLSFKRFLERCQKTGTLPMPIFSNASNQVLSIVGQYISDGMAKAMSEVFMRAVIERTSSPLDQAGHSSQDGKEEEVSYIQVKELNLDDNGLKDGSFASILAALATQPSLKRLTYVNNEIGAKSIVQLARILSNEHEGDLSDIRLTRVKASKNDLNGLLQALSHCTNRLVRLRLSHLALDEFVLMESLKQMVLAMPHIQELSLSNINIHGRQLSDIMEVISENCQQIQYLNLSYNSLPQHKDWREKFLSQLVSMITTAAKLIDIDLSGMNLRSNVQVIMWPLSKSKTLQAIHLSDNNIPKAIEINMLMVFGVKSTDDASDGFSITGKLDPRQLKRNAMSVFQVKMQEKLEGLEITKNKSLKDQEEQIFGSTGGEANMVQSYEDATARIANAVEIRDLKHDKHYMQSCMKGGLGRHASTVQPLVITRKLGRPELIFNNADSKNTHFKVNAQAKWVRNQGNECWICDSWKYTVIFFSRNCWSQHYSEIEDQVKIAQLQEMYDLEQEDLLMSENKDFPLILGGVTKNTAVSMIDIAMFNLFLDEKQIKKALGGQGERAMRTMLTVSQGMKMQKDSKLNIQLCLAFMDWLVRFKENAPFNDKEMLTVNLPQTKLCKKIENCEVLTNKEKAQRATESQNDVYVYAGYVEPGKHQIIIKDQMTNRWFSREIVVEARRPEIISCSHVEPEKVKESIKRFQKIDEETGVATTMIDLDSSVFMNFKRYTKQDVDNCFKADMRQSCYENVVRNEEDLQDCTIIFQKNYAAYCQFFHEMAAQLDNFPLIALSDLPKVLFSISMMSIEKAERVGEAVIAIYKSNEANQPCASDTKLNRVKFAEVLLSVLLADKKDTDSKQGSTSGKAAVPNKDMEAIPEEEDFCHSQHLLTLFKAYIVPSLENKNEETMPISLNAFRDRFCWVEKVNAILELNLEGIMDVFCKYQGEEGFVYDGAEKVLKGIGSQLPPRVTKMLFDLSQMTVIDESVNAEEYDDMELVEFLEFLVRIAHHQYLGEDRSIELKLSDLLSDVLQLANVQFVEGPKREFQTQASDEDTAAFHRYMQKKATGY